MAEKTTFMWPKVVSEVSLPIFWGVIRFIRVVSVFLSVIGSDVSEISRLARFYVKSSGVCGKGRGGFF